jgi:membrane protease YdiL (CAAX protease family)
MDESKRISINKILLLFLVFSLMVLIEDVFNLFFYDVIPQAVYVAIHLLQLLAVILFVSFNKIKVKDLFAIKEVKLGTVLLIILCGVFLNLGFGQVDHILNDVFHLTPIVEADGGNVSVAFQLFLAFFAGIVAPIFEEIEFRGLLFNRLQGEKKSLSLIAVVLSSLMFSVLHTGSITMGAFAMAILSCLLFYYSKTLIYSVALHFGGNFLGAVLIFLSAFSNNAETAQIEQSVSNNLSTYLVMGVLISIAIAIGTVGILAIKKCRKYSDKKEKSDIFIERAVQKPMEKSSSVATIILLIAYFLVCSLSWALIIIPLFQSNN